MLCSVHNRNRKNDRIWTTKLGYEVSDFTETLTYLMNLMCKAFLLLCVPASSLLAALILNSCASMWICDHVRYFKHDGSICV